MVTSDAAAIAVQSLSMLPYFPTEPIVKPILANLLMEMCNDDQELDWLTKRTLKLWTKWESPRELRAIYCSRFKPKDGFEVNYSNLFADNVVPSERTISPPPLIALPPGAAVSCDMEIDTGVVLAAGPKAIPPVPEILPPEDQKAAFAFSKLLEEIETGPPDRAMIPLKKPLRLSRIVPELYRDPPSAQPRPEGTYQKITDEDLRREIDKRRTLRESRENH